MSGEMIEKGKAELWAFARQGQKELTQILPAFPDSVQPVEEPGLMGNPTQREVYEQQHGEDKAPEPQFEPGE